MLPGVAVVPLLRAQLLPHTIEGRREHAVTFYLLVGGLFVLHRVLQHLRPELEVHHQIIYFELSHPLTLQVFAGQQLLFGVPTDNNQVTLLS